MAGIVVGTEGKWSKSSMSNGLAGESAESVDAVEYVEIGRGTSGFSFFGDRGDGHGEIASDGVDLCWPIVFALLMSSSYGYGWESSRDGGG